MEFSRVVLIYKIDNNGRIGYAHYAKDENGLAGEVVYNGTDSDSLNFLEHLKQLSK